MYVKKLIIFLRKRTTTTRGMAAENARFWSSKDDITKTFRYDFEHFCIPRFIFVMFSYSSYFYDLKLYSDSSFKSLYIMWQPDPPRLRSGTSCSARLHVVHIIIMVCVRTRRYYTTFTRAVRTYTRGDI